MTYPGLAQVLTVIGALSGISGIAPGIVNFVRDQPEVSYAASAIEAGTGRISGTVVDEHWVPAANFTVQAFPLHMTWFGTIPQTKTDEHGHFVMTVPAGRDSDGRNYGMRWAVYPRQEKDYYPDLGSRFYTTAVSKAQQIEFMSEPYEATVELRLGPKAGALKGHVTDALTGAAINPYFEFAWASEPGNRRGEGTSSGYRILVPSNTDITLIVLSCGYKKWSYPGTINIGPGQDMTLDIHMEPVRQDNQGAIPK